MADEKIIKGKIDIAFPEERVLAYALLAGYNPIIPIEVTKTDEEGNEFTTSEDAPNPETLIEFMKKRVQTILAKEFATSLIKENEIKNRNEINEKNRLEAEAILGGIAQAIVVSEVE